MYLAVRVWLLAALTASAFAQVGYWPNPFKDIPGKDIYCDVGNSFCRRCGDLAYVAEQCTEYDVAGVKCEAFAYDGRCGYLKYSAGPQISRSGWTSFVHITADPPPIPGYTALGGQDIYYHDISCDGAPFCKVCSPLGNIADKCLRLTACVAFTYDGKCGYLKKDATTDRRRGWASYLKD